MEAGFSVSIKMPRPEGVDAKVVMNALRKASPILVEKLEPIIRERTPRRSGALREALTGKPYTGDVSGARESSLAKFYYNDAPQIEEWGRVYAPYQEFLPLGKSTYTGQKAQMLYRIQSDDEPLIQEWADAVVEETLGIMAAEGV